MPQKCYCRLMMVIITLFVCLLIDRWHLTIRVIFLIMPFLVSKFYAPILSIRAENSLLVLDNFSNSLICLTVWVRGIVLIVSTYILHAQKIHRYFHSLCVLQCILLVLTFRVHHIILFYFLFEGCILPTFLIILVWGITPERLRAGVYIFIYTLCASLPMLIGLLFIFHTEHTISYLMNISNIPSFVVCMILLAFIVKLPIYIFHLWLPKAHVEAPVGGSIYLAGVLLKLGPYGLYRLMSITMIESWVVHTISTIRLFGAIARAVICIRLTDIKIMVAYASVSHIGITMFSILTNTGIGILGAKLMLVAHGLRRAILFSIVNFYYEWTHTRSILVNRGMLHAAPSLAFWWFIGILANIGIPPSLNMVREVFMFGGILSVEQAEFAIIPWMIVLYSVLTLVYRINLYTNVHHGEVRYLVNYIYVRQICHTSSLFLCVPLFSLTFCVGVMF